MKRRHWMLAAAIAALAVLALLFWPTPERREAQRRSAQVAEMAEQWNGEVQFDVSYDALNPYASGADAGAGQAVATDFDPNDEFWGLPRNPGYEEVAYNCAACHSLQLVMQQRRSAARWNETIDWMIAQQGMPAPPGNERERIVAYLSRTYGEAPAAP